MARIPRPATSAHSGSKDVLFIASNFIPLMESRTGEFLRRRQAVAVALWAVGTGMFYAGARRFPQRSGYKNERVTRLELATSSLARRCSTTELHPHFTMISGHAKKPKNTFVRLFYPAYTQAQMRTRQNMSAFQKVGECLYRYSSNGVYYARFE